MALTIPHNSQAGIAVASGGRAANYVGAGAFMTPGQSAMPAALDSLSRGMSKLGGAVNEMLLDRQRMRNATDLLADKIDYENALREFDSNYRQAKQGTDARTATEDYDAFHKERLDILHKKWGGNPYLMESVSRMAEGIRAPSMNRAVAFRDQQEEAHKEAVGKAEWQQTLGKLADPSLSYDDRLKALKDSEASLRMLAGQNPVFNEKGEVVGHTGGRNVDAELERRRQTFHGEQVETLLAQGKTEEASKYVRANTGAFGENSNNLMEKIRAVEKSNATKAQAATEKAHKAALDTVYAGWRDEARKAGLDLESTQSLMTQRIADNLATPKERKYVMRLFEDDLDVETMRRDAGDMTGIMQAEEATKGMLPSQKVAWLDQNWNGSRAGREKAEEELTKPPRLETPENTRRYNELRAMIDLGKITEPEEVSAKAWEYGLTTKQANGALDYQKAGGQAGKATVTRVQRVWKSLNPGKDVKNMSADLPDLILQSLEPGKPVTDDALTKTVSRLALMGESRAKGALFTGFGVDESLADALRNNREETWLSDADVPKYETLRESGLDVKIRELLQKHGIAPTAEKIVLFSQDKEAMRKYGLAE